MGAAIFQQRRVKVSQRQKLKIKSFCQVFGGSLIVNFSSRCSP